MTHTKEMMKTKRQDEELVRVGFRIPMRLKKAMEDTAVNERRSINDQAIVLLEKALLAGKAAGAD